MTSDHFIESLFTSSFLPQSHNYSRAELGFSDDGFVAVIVGARLDDEITDEFMNVLLKLMNHSIYCAFMGGFEGFQDWYDKNENFKKYAIDLGFEVL